MSIELAKEKESFPFLIGKNKLKKPLNLPWKRINTGYMKKMPESISSSYFNYGIVTPFAYSCSNRSNWYDGLEYQPF